MNLKPLVNNENLWNSYVEYLEAEKKILFASMTRCTCVEELTRYQGEARRIEKMLRLQEEVRRSEHRQSD